MSPRPAHQTEARRILIASPGDLKREYQLLPELFDQLSASCAAQHGRPLQVVEWRDTPRIRKRIETKRFDELTEADLIIFLLWKRWGAPLGKYSSMFARIYSLAKRFSKPLLLYFRDLSDTLLVSPDEQVSAVIRFRDSVEMEGRHRYYWYEDERHLAQLLTGHLQQWFAGYWPSGASIESLPLHRQRLEGWTRVIRQIKPGKSKRAFGMARRGFMHASGRRFTKACQCLAEAIALAPEPYILNEYGLFLKENGSLQKARLIFEQLAKMGQTQEDNLISASALRHLGDISARKRDLPEADLYYEKALSAEQGLNRLLKEGELYDARARLYVEFGQYDIAQRFYETATELFKKADFPHGQALSCLGLLDLFMRREDAEEAYNACEKALEIVKKIGGNPLMINELQELLDKLRDIKLAIRK
jgi:tetratricopeptide (TPR) repeat protein